MYIIANRFKMACPNKKKIVCILEDIQLVFFPCLCVYIHKIGVILTKLPDWHNVEQLSMLWKKILKIRFSMLALYSSI